MVYRRMYDTMVQLTSQIVVHAPRLFKMMSHQRPWLSRDNDIVISGSTVLQASTGEQYNVFDLDVYCKPKAFFVLHHHLTTVQEMTVVSTRDFQYVRGNSFVHTVLTFRKHLAAGLVAKHLQVIVLC